MLRINSLKQELINEKTVESEARLENLEEFKSITKSYEEKYGIISLGEFLEQISLVADVADYKNIDEAVTLMTVHSAKGLENDNVIILNLVDDSLGFPNKIKEMNIFKYIKKEDYLDEERRLFYVALTRAKKKVFLLTNKASTSIFVKELNKDYKFKIKTFNFN